MAGTVHGPEWIFFPSDFVTGHHGCVHFAFILPAGTRIQCIAFARSVLVFQPRVEPVFLRLPQATDPFSANLVVACFSPSTGFRDRPRSDRSWFCECAAKLAPTRSGDPRGEDRHAARSVSSPLSLLDNHSERERALTTVARIDLAPSPVIFIADQKMFSRTPRREKCSFLLQLQRNWTLKDRALLLQRFPRNFQIYGKRQWWIEASSAVERSSIYIVLMENGCHVY